MDNLLIPIKIKDNLRVRFEFDDCSEFLFEEMFDNDIVFLSRNDDFLNQGRCKNLEQYTVIDLNIKYDNKIALTITNDNCNFGHLLINSKSHMLRYVESLINKLEAIVNRDVFILILEEKMGDDWREIDRCGQIIITKSDNIKETIKNIFNIK